ncbi:MAG: DNA translocase FtsK 4TM domain-containing protein, partial [Paludibacter sp.]|nr:DNA translocase FtsK 4TM domain-containing protein [Paludibacter sp.]
MPPIKPGKKSTSTTNLPKSKKKLSFAVRLKNFFNSEGTHIGLGLILLLVSALLILAFVMYFAYGTTDQSVLYNKTFAQINQARQSIQNPTGMLGAYLSHFFINKMFGVASVLIYVYILCVGLRLFSIKINLWKVFFHSFFWLLWLSVTFGYLLNPIALSGEWFCLPGGNHGSAVNAWLTSYIGSIGMPMVLSGVMLIYLIVFNKATVPFIKKLFTRKAKSSKTTDNQDSIINKDDDKEATVAVGTEIVPADWITKPENNDDVLIIEPTINDDSVELEIEKPVTDTNSGNGENGSIPEKASNEPENDDPYYNIEKLGLYDPKL